MSVLMRPRGTPTSSRSPPWGSMAVSPLADEIPIGIALDSWRPTQGTRITGQRNKARRLIIANGALAPLPDPAPTDSWRFPEPFGAQEVVELPFTETILI